MLGTPARRSLSLARGTRDNVGFIGRGSGFWDHYDVDDGEDADGACGLGLWLRMSIDYGVRKALPSRRKICILGDSLAPCLCIYIHTNKH